MGTSGRQPGTPVTRREAKSRARWFARKRRFAILLASAFAFLMMFSVEPLFAQQQWPSSPSGPSGFPPSQPGFPPDQGSLPTGANDGSAPDRFRAMEASLSTLPTIPVDYSRFINAEACETWTAASLNSPTVSVARLAVPGKASHEFQKACGDYKDHKLESAEAHARKAVKIYPDYAAAWVVLGQILHAQHHDKEAAQACHQAEKVDPQYAPPYICLAGFAARANDWDKAYSLSDHALSLDPATDPYAFLYTATADLHLNRLDEAELYGLSAEKLDKWHKIPEIHLVLALVYEAKGEREAEAKELRKFLKNSPHNSDWGTAKVTLAKLEALNAK